MDCDDPMEPVRMEMLDFPITTGTDAS